MAGSYRMFSDESTSLQQNHLSLNSHQTSQQKIGSHVLSPHHDFWFRDCFGCIAARRIDGRGAWGWSYFVDAPKHFWRGLTGNLSEDGLISEGEKKKLEDHGAKEELEQNYLAWRRSCIFFVLVPLFVLIVLRGIEFAELRKSFAKIKKENAPLYDALKTVVILFSTLEIVTIALLLFSVILACLALRYWYDFRLSRRLAMFGWLACFLGPFLVSAVPYQQFLGNFEVRNGNSTVSPNTNTPTGTNTSSPTINLNNPLRFIVGLTFTTYFLKLIIPPVLTLPLAIIRGSLTVRSLLPTSRIPGIITKATPLISSSLIWLFFLPIVQLLNSWLVYVAILLFIAAPTVFLIFGKYISSPTNAERAATTAMRLRYAYLGANAVALILVIVFLTQTNWGTQLLSSLFKANNIADIISSFLVEYFYSNVFFGDLVTRQMLKTSVDEIRLQRNDSQLYADFLERRKQLFPLTNLPAHLAPNV